MIELHDLVKTFGAVARPRRPGPRRRGRVRCTASWARTGRASPPPSACCSGCCAPTAAPHGCSAATRGRRRPTCTAGSPTCRARSACGPTSPAGRSSTCSAGCAVACDEKKRADLLERFELDPGKKARTYSKGNRQKVAVVAAFAVQRRALPARRAHLRARPADGGGVPAVRARGQGRGRHGAAQQPHPGRGRGAQRPDQHHPQRRRRAVRDARRAAPPHAHDGDRRDRLAGHPHRRRARCAQPAVPRTAGWSSTSTPTTSTLPSRPSRHWAYAH